MTTAVAPQTPNLRQLMTAHADKLAAFGVDPAQYIEAAMMATAKNPDLLQCTPASIMLSLRQVAQTGLQIGRTAHLVPFKDTCTFIPDYTGLIELAIATGRVVGIRTRCVYDGEAFEYYEDTAGPVLKHQPKLSGNGGKIVGAYAIADLRFGRFKVEFMNVDEIEAIRRKSKSWKNGELPDWYGRKTVVRKLCKTLPQNAKLQQALRFDDADPEEIPDGQYSAVEPPKQIGSGATVGAVIPAPPDGDEYSNGSPLPATGRPSQSVDLASHHGDNPYGLWTQQPQQPQDAVE